MTRTLIFGETTLEAFDWVEAPLDGSARPHARDQEILETGVAQLNAGEVAFHSDLPIPFDTTFEVKGDGRKFVVISSKGHLHVAKPY